MARGTLDAPALPARKQDRAEAIGPARSDFRIHVRLGASRARPLVGLRRRRIAGLVALIVGVGAPLAMGSLLSGNDFGALEVETLFLLPVIASALLGGLIPALLASVAGFAVLAYEADRTRLGGPDTDVLWALVFFLLVALVLSNSLTRESVARASLQQARERLAFLARAAGVLTAAGLDYRRCLEQLARLPVPRLGNLVAIHVIDHDGEIRTLAVGHDDRVDEALAGNLLLQPPPDRAAVQGVPAVIRTGAAEIFASVDDDSLRRIATNPVQHTLLRGIGIRSAMIVPLRSPQRTFGAMTLAVTGTSSRYTEADRELAEDLAARAGTALENVMLYQERSREAITLQRSLLPAEIPEIPGVEVVVRFRPSGGTHLVGGDFYDVFLARDGVWALVLGDVSGKGMEAATVTGLARHTLRMAVMREDRPSGALAVLNDAILRERTDRFVTAAVGLLEPTDAGANFTVAAGGHPLPLVLRADGRVETVGVHGMLLGLFADAAATDASARLDIGDALVLFTDGVLDERLDRPERELGGVLASAAGSDAEGIAAVLERSALTRDTTPDDDIAIVVVRLIPPVNGATGRVSA